MWASAACGFGEGGWAADGAAQNGTLRLWRGWLDEIRGLRRGFGVALGVWASAACGFGEGGWAADGAAQNGTLRLWRGWLDEIRGLRRGFGVALGVCLVSPQVERVSTLALWESPAQSESQSPDFIHSRPRKVAKSGFRPLAWSHLSPQVERVSTLALWESPAQSESQSPDFIHSRPRKVAKSGFRPLAWSHRGVAGQKGAPCGWALWPARLPGQRAP